MEHINFLYKPDELRKIIRDELQTALNTNDSNSTNNEDEYFDIEGAADYLKLSPHTLRKKAQKNSIPCYKRNGKWLFSKRELKAYIQLGKVISINEIYDTNYGR